MKAMKVYHLTIQENGHSRRFVYEDRDDARSASPMRLPPGSTQSSRRLCARRRSRSRPRATGGRSGPRVWKSASRAGPVRDASLAGEPNRRCACQQDLGRNRAAR